MDPAREGLLKPPEKKGRFRDDRESDLESDIDTSEYIEPSDDLDDAPTKTTQRSLLGKTKPGGSRFCTTCFALSFLGVLGMLVAGGFFVRNKYLQVPPDGLSPPWYPSPKGGTARTWAESYTKAANLVERMSLVEKVNVTTGTGWMMGLAVGNTGPALEAGFPGLALQDGPLGIRFGDNATAFPAGITVGATWNKELMYRRGKAHGHEARLKGINVLLGPCVGPLGRMPAGGRNWEGFGSDPYLQGIAGAETVRGIQSEGVMATIKHLVANEQEHFRQSWEWGLPNALSTNIDDRTMHELYAWPFADAVKAGVASVMCSYNMVNNSYACGNSKLLNGILKDEMGFQGFVMSDWLAQRSGVASALAGLDMTMPGDGLYWQDGDSLWGPKMTEAVLNESLPLDRLDDMVTRIVASWYQLGQDDKGLFDGEGPNFSSWTNDEMGVIAPASPSDQDQVRVNQFVNVQGDHGKIARQVAAEGIVLLKNDGVLPLSRAGKPGKDKTRIGIFGEDAGPGNGPNYCKDRGCNQGTLGSGWGSGAVEFPYLVPPVDALTSGFGDKVNVTAHLTNNLPFSKTPEILTDRDVCIVFGNSDSGEGFLAWGSVGGDRNDLSLQKNGDDLIVQVAENCGGGSGETIVVIHAVGPVVMEKWINLPGVKAVLMANLPGQESGTSLADVIFGDENPSGKLPYTIGKSLDDYGDGGQVLYLPNGVVPQQDFSEGLYIDYRHFDKFDVAPRFEFGFGLSYTSFQLSKISAKTIKARSRFPDPRPDDGAVPPKYDSKIPDKADALFPSSIRILEKYVYPYLESVDRISPGAYPYPEGYDMTPHLSGAGGDEGGNPDLWETYVEVSVNVKNIGSVAGKVVPQLYMSYPANSTLDMPVRVLRGFDKFLLGKGETKTVTFNVTRRDLSYWDVVHQNWHMLEGEYKFAAGLSSRDLPVEVSW